MRSGSGKIFVKSNTKSPDSCLTEITNNHSNTKSQIRSDKADLITQLDSFCSKHEEHQNAESIYSRTSNIQQQEKKKLDDPSSIVRKLSCLNSIFKQIKMLKQSDISYQTLKALSRIEDRFIGIEREILKNPLGEQQLDQ